MAINMVALLAVISVGIPESASAQIQLDVVAKGLTHPVHVASSPSGEPALVVVEQVGRVQKIVPLSRSGSGTELFLDISGRVRSGGEMGLLGVAFDPGYPSRPYICVNYTTGEPQLRTVISRFTVAEGRADPASEVVLLTFDQPYTNHNGGQLEFGPDGFLYIGTGDGGAANDPHGHGQNTSSLLGKILRIDVRRTDVHGGDRYTIPSDNPFAEGKGGRPEIFATGLRNPWRFSFDRANGALWVADVGQNRWEEINVVRRGGNYGWNAYEGNECFRDSSLCTTGGRFEMPVYVYGRDEGVSVTGGFVYRGRAIPELSGKYIFGDFMSGTVWAIDGNGRNQAAPAMVLLRSEHRISTFGQDRDGELYLAAYGDGKVYKLVPKVTQYGLMR